MQAGRFEVKDGARLTPIGTDGRAHLQVVLDPSHPGLRVPDSDSDLIARVQPPPFLAVVPRELGNEVATPASTPSTSVVPRLVKFSGIVKDSAGRDHSGTFDLTFALYELQEGGNPLWAETQSVRADEQGRYTVLLHHYTSTYCIHGYHEHCRKTCKTCGAACLLPIRLRLGAAMLFALLLVALAIPGCGGGGAAVTHNPGTPAGTYSLTVTGTVTSGSATLTHSFTLKVTVQ